MNAIVVMVVLVVAGTVNAVTANTLQPTNRTMLEDILGGIANLWTKVQGNDKPQSPSNVKEFIASKEGLKNIDNLNDFTNRVKFIESSGGSNRINPDSSARGGFQFLTTNHLTNEGDQRFNEEGDPLVSSYQVGLNRLKDIYADMGKDTEWISQAKENDNPLDLTDEQEEELFLANLWKQIGTSDLLKRIDEGDDLAKYELYSKYHHTNPDKATNELAMSTFNLED
tara:strand:- start:70 stop:747 length:678 start_codon:yes stop_codon:yes gene_type:complete